jgi:hypothetical protein
MKWFSTWGQTTSSRFFPRKEVNLLGGRVVRRDWPLGVGPIGWAESRRGKLGEMKPVAGSANVTRIVRDAPAAKTDNAVGSGDHHLRDRQGCANINSCSPTEWLAFAAHLLQMKTSCDSDVWRRTQLNLGNNQ